MDNWEWKMENCGWDFY